MMNYYAFSVLLAVLVVGVLLGSFWLRLDDPPQVEHCRAVVEAAAPSSGFTFGAATVTEETQAMKVHLEISAPTATEGRFETEALCYYRALRTNKDDSEFAQWPERVVIAGEALESDKLRSIVSTLP
jgi:hypothetical protein